ncbi:MAG: MarR family winged helix-turn-helix transcriptional regulator [Candidatus Binatia bacterium]|nr:MarR family winged helix-turn-helix transcriptional regulator [Candidatus Binatia bacterium]
MTAAATEPAATLAPAAALLEFFYPIHYKLGMALEDVLRRGQLTRKQVAILWLIRAEGGPERRMPRKEIERLLTTWFEISGSAITKALRAMARPPLQLVKLVEDPHSAREKLVLLTPKGEQFLLAMIEAGQQYIQQIAVHLSEADLCAGIRFLSQVTAVLEQMRDVRKASDTKGRRGSPRLTVAPRQPEREGTSLSPKRARKVSGRRRSVVLPPA